MFHFVALDYWRFLLSVCSRYISTIFVSRKHKQTHTYTHTRKHPNAENAHMSTHTQTGETGNLEEGIKKQKEIVQKRVREFRMI